MLSMLIGCVRLPSLWRIEQRSGRKNGSRLNSEKSSRAGHLMLHALRTRGEQTYFERSVKCGGEES